MNPILEKKGILGHTDEASRRPADVAIPTWCSGKGLAIDVAVILSAAPTNMKVPDPVEAYGLNVKHKKYDASFVGTPWFFNAMIWESSGGLNEERSNSCLSLLLGVRAAGFVCIVLLRGVVCRVLCSPVWRNVFSIVLVIYFIKFPIHLVLS